MTYIPGFENPIGYVVAMRQWKVDCGLLTSVVAGMVWHPHEAPKADTTNEGWFHSPGYYAAKTDHHELLDYHSTITTITGTVALWGEIIEHEKGYRAEYAYPLSFEHCTPRS